jgi:carbamoyl-phosphate synthase large subunit
VPFVSKATGVPLAKIAALVMAGQDLGSLAEQGLVPRDPGHYRRLSYTSVKAPVLPFGRFPGVDTLLGPEMKSTGEVMGSSADLGVALAKALTSAGAGLPSDGTVFVSVANRDKRAIVFPTKRLADLGFKVLATRGTAAVLSRAGLRVTTVRKVSEGGQNVVDLIRAGRVDLVINTPFGRDPRGDGYWIRTASAAAGVPCVTTLPGALAAVQGIEALRSGTPTPVALQDVHAAILSAPAPRQLRLEEAVGVPAGESP